ncbi:MAG: NifU family protein [Acidobacteriia bacterium]|nr:NifU family protein [Terriglobia bacterium]
MVTREQVEDVLDKIRPAIMMDGGNVELVEVVENCAKIRLVGACMGCPSSMMTLQFGIEETLRAEIPDFDHVIPVSAFE